MESIMSLVTVFIAIAIMLSVGVVILGNAQTGFDCKDLEGYNTSSPTDSTSWAKTCLDVAEQGQTSFNLLVVILIVVAAVAILIVIRML